MKIYDCFTYYNEKELLHWRLKMLYDVVDYFVIVEANKTFQNKDKAFNFEKNKEVFSLYMDKIIYIKLDKDIPYTSDWSIEIFQRNAISQGLTDCNDNDLIIISDIDEFPAPNIIKNIKNDCAKINVFKCTNYLFERSGIRGLSRKLRCFFKNINSLKFRNKPLEFLQHSPVVCEQMMYEFFVNYRCKSDWCGPIFVLYKNLATPQDLRRKRNVLPMIFGGWHFSSMGGVKAILNKLNATSDGMLNPVLKLPIDEQEGFIKNALEDGNLWWRNEKLLKQEISHLDIPYIEWFAKEYPYMTNC